MKTKPTDSNVESFLKALDDDQRRRDCFVVMRLMEEVTGEEPMMWGSDLVGFGSYHYKYASGHEGDIFLTGFAPRKKNLTLYVMSGFDRFEPIMRRLGTYKTGKSCLYLKQLSDVDTDVLRELVAASVAVMRDAYPAK